MVVGYFDNNCYGKSFFVCACWGWKDIIIDFLCFGSVALPSFITPKLVS
jgi:hypothetical protein